MQTINGKKSIPWAKAREEILSDPEVRAEYGAELSQFPDKATSVIDINGQSAVVTYEADINAFRGNFLNVNGYCDFVATSIDALHREGEIALSDWLQDCKEDGLAPFR